MFVAGPLSSGDRIPPENRCARPACGVPWFGRVRNLSRAVLSETVSSTLVAEPTGYPQPRLLLFFLDDKRVLTAGTMANAANRLDVPSFDNNTGSYSEFRKRAMLFKARMRLEGKQKQAAILLLGQLSGMAWDVCEHLAENPDSLEADDAFDKLIGLLDARFRHDKQTELPDAFEDYFFRSSRRPRETLFDYIARIRLSTKKVAEHRITLPDEVQGWLLMRRAGLSEEQKTLVMSQIGMDLGFEKVAKTLQSTFGQQQVMTDRRQKSAVHYLEEGGDAQYDDDGYADDTYYQDDWYQQDWEDEYDEDGVYYGEEEQEEWYDEAATGTYDQSHDVDEYDDVYSAYVDARKRMNDLRLSRGFYPIVALAPEGGRSDSWSSGKGSKSRKGKTGKGRGGKTGKGRGGKNRPKGKAKGKGQGAAPFNRPRPSSSPTLNGPPSSESVCLRCGKTGHWARECTQPPSRKRPAPGPPDDQMMVLVGESAEQLSDMFLASEHIAPQEAVLDGGAQSFVVGQGTPPGSWHRLGT